MSTTSPEEMRRSARRIFADAIELDRADRPGFLDRSCGDDEELRAEVERYLEADDAPPGMLDGDAWGAVAPSLEGAERPGGDGVALEVGHRVDTYRLVRVLGEGGMGTVWLAEQEEGVRRSVALKVVKLGMDTREILARFARERQALAVMEHPSIATVHDTGVTPTGQPFFVMEYIRGVPLTEYCDSRRLTVEERLELFIQLCSAVQHAHHKGVIHRDLKPSNVLVTDTESDRPLVKVIDFGVARAVTGSLGDQALLTSIGQGVGTPAYMSPEQAEQSELDVDTRTDVYSLGVVLYELLSGGLPFTSEQLAGPRIAFGFKLRDLVVPRPSVRFNTLADTQATVARFRSTDVATLRRALTGDLDWIVMRAMEKDRTRRYDTVQALSADLARYLASEPVEARPPDARYRLSRFVRRNRAPVAAASAVLAAVLFGLIGTSRGLVLARIAEQDAVAAEAEAQLEARSAAEIADFLTGLFENADPAVMAGDIRAVDLLERGADRVRSELSDQPLVQARFMETIGEVYRSLRLYDVARSLFEESLAIRERELGPNAAEVGSSLIALSRVLGAFDEHELNERNLERAKAIFESAEGATSPGYLQAATSLATFAISRRDYDAAEQDLQHVQAMLAQVEEPEHVGDWGGEAFAASIEMMLGQIDWRRGRVETAEVRMTEALAVHERVLPEDHPQIAAGLRQLGAFYGAQFRPTESDSVLRLALASEERVYGAGHPILVGALTQLAGVAIQRHDDEEAWRLHERAIAISDSVYGPGHPVAAEARLSYGRRLRGLEQYEAVGRLMTEVVQPPTGGPRPSESQVAQAWGLFSEAAEGAGDVESAIDARRRSLDRHVACCGVAARAAGSARFQLALLLVRADRRAEVDQVLARHVALAAERWGVGSDSHLLAVDQMSQVLVAAEEWDAAIEWKRRLLEWRETYNAPDDTRLTAAYASLATTLRQAGRADEALDINRRRVEHAESLRDQDFFRLVQALEGSYHTFIAAGRTEDAVASQERALGILQEELAGRPDTARIYLTYLGLAAMRTDRFELAERLKLRSREILRERQGISLEIHLEEARSFADLYVRWGKPANAEEMLVEGLQIYEEWPHEPSRRLSAVLADLKTLLVMYADHLDGQGRSDEAVRHRARAASIE